MSEGCESAVGRRVGGRISLVSELYGEPSD
jgi:hypothetical protein